MRSIESSSLGLQETVEPERRPAAHQAAQFALYAARIAAVVGTYAANKNEKLMPFVAKNVTAKGTVTKDKDGKMTIDVSSIEAKK